MKADNVFVLVGPSDLRGVNYHLITRSRPEYSYRLSVYNDENICAYFSPRLLVQMYVSVSQRPSKNAIKCSNIIF